MVRWQYAARWRDLVGAAHQHRFIRRLVLKMLQIRLGPALPIRDRIVLGHAVHDAYHLRSFDRARDGFDFRHLLDAVDEDEINAGILVELGAANRLLSPLAHRVFVSFAETMPYFGSDKVRIVGTPIRREFLEGVGAEVHMPPDAGPTLLVLGGSQGARSVNRAVVAAMPVLTARYPGLHIIHQTGERDYAEVKDNYTNVVRDENLEVVPFLYDVANAFRRADLLISRSGATTVAEITACGKPAIFIPFPHAIYGHQERNAHVLEHAGAAAVILEAELTGDTLAQTILSLIADRPRLAEMARRSRSLGRSDSAEQIVTMCRQLVAGAAA